MSLLKSRGVHIDDDNYAIHVLSRINYYRLTAYLIPYKQDNGTYRPVEFANIVNIYKFDQLLRFFCFQLIEQIEITFRTRLSYFHGHNYGPAGYLNANNFHDRTRHNEFLVSFFREKENNAKNLFISHHDDHYGGTLPIWVAVEICTLSTLSKLYSNMPMSDQRRVATSYGVPAEHIRSWIRCVCELRNRCAHYMRLYDHVFFSSIKTKDGLDIDVNNTRLYNIVLVSKYLVGDPPGDSDIWGKAITLLGGIIETFYLNVELSKIGFPESWKEDLLSLPSF